MQKIRKLLSSLMILAMLLALVPTGFAVSAAKTEVVPTVAEGLTNESHDFEDSVYSNGLSFTSSDNSNCPICNTWTPAKGTGASTYVLSGSNTYLNLSYDGAKHNYRYSADTAFNFTADVKPGTAENHFAGFIFNYGDEVDGKENKFYETNGLNGEAFVSKSGIGVSIHPNYIDVYVVTYGTKLGYITSRYTTSGSLGSSFNSFSALDNGVDSISFSINGVVFAVVKYADAGLLPESVTDYCEKYYRTASICGVDGTVYASTSEALVSYTKSVAMGSRFRTMAIDNMTLAAVKPDPLAFTAATVDLSDAPAIKYYVSATALAEEGYTAPYVVTTFNGIETTITDYKTVGEEYVFAFYGVTPESLNNTISTTFYASKNGAVEKGSTSKGTMANYCYGILSNYADDSSMDNLKRVAVDYLEYGARLQEYIGYKTNNLADKNLTAEQKAWGTASIEEPANDMVMLSRRFDASLDWTGVALSLKNTPQIKFVFKTDSISGLTFKVSNFTEEWTYDESDIVALDDGQYAVYFDGGLNSNLRRPVYITAYGADGKAVSKTFGYSVESYVARIGTDSTLGKTLKAMMEYGEATKSYEGEVSVPQITVTFVDYNGEVLKVDTVPVGGSATPPANPTRRGYEFNGWEGSYVNVSSDVTVTATYVMTDESLIEVLMEEGKVVCDFIRDNGFIYHDANINPAINWSTLDPATAINPDERIVSCDRLVDWILYRAGFVDQPYAKGETVWTLIDWCIEHGFTKITNVNDLRAGDVVFVNPYSNGMPAHTFMCAGTNLRYDGGSDSRIQCVTGKETVDANGVKGQPFSEPIYEFMYAYRPHASCLEGMPGINIYAPVSSSVAVPSESATTLASDDAAFTTKYTPGTGYKQYELKLDLSSSPSSSDTNYWNSTYIGARLPTSTSLPTAVGGIWIAFTNMTTARIFVGPVSGAWNVSEYKLTLPESFATAHTVQVVDTGDAIKYYMYTSAGERTLLCTIRIDTLNDLVIVRNANDAIVYTGNGSFEDYGYFGQWSHYANSSVTNVTMSGAN